MGGIKQLCKNNLMIEWCDVQKCFILFYNLINFSLSAIVLSIKQWLYHAFYLFPIMSIVLEHPENKLVHVVTCIIAVINRCSLNGICFFSYLKSVRHKTQLFMLTKKHKILCPEDCPVLENLKVQFYLNISLHVLSISLLLALNYVEHQLYKS